MPPGRLLYLEHRWDCPYFCYTLDGRDPVCGIATPCVVCAHGPTCCHIDTRHHHRSTSISSYVLVKRESPPYPCPYRCPPTIERPWAH